MSDLAAFHAVAQGRVQGVNYRSFTSRNAAQLNLNGYVRNLSDSSVEIYAEGERSQLEKLLEKLREGPPGARVNNLSLGWSEFTGKYHEFEVTR